MHKTKNIFHFESLDVAMHEWVLLPMDADGVIVKNQSLFPTLELPCIV